MMTTPRDGDDDDDEEGRGLDECGVPASPMVEFLRAEKSS